MLSRLNFRLSRSWGGAWQKLAALFGAQACRKAACLPALMAASNIAINSVPPLLSFINTWRTCTGNMDFWFLGAGRGAKHPGTGHPPMAKRQESREKKDFLSMENFGNREQGDRHAWGREAEAGV